MLSKNYGCKITRKNNKKQWGNEKKTRCEKIAIGLPKYWGKRMKEDFHQKYNHLFINKLIIKIFFQEFVKSDEKSCNFAPSNMAVVAQLVRVPDCGSVGRRFESDLPPKSKAATRNCRCFFCLGFVHFLFDCKKKMNQKKCALPLCKFRLKSEFTR